MKNLNVFMNPGVHPQFKEITDFPPAKVKYYFKQALGDHNSSIIRKRRALISVVHNSFQLPRMSYVPNDSRYDILHSTRGILLFNRKPWIVDIESGAAFSGLNWQPMKKPIMKFLIKRFLSSSYCKKIMPQSNAAKQSLFENFDCSKFKDKIETLYLAYRTTKLKRKDSDYVRISFIGRSFWGKGGHDLQKAFEILSKRYKIKLKMKTVVPSRYRLKMKNATYLENIKDPKEFYNEIFGDCDIYVQPTIVDSFGVSVLEAMSTGLPIVCTDDFTLPELVEDGHNGFLVKSAAHWYEYARKGKLEAFVRKSEQNHPETVKELVKKISILIEDKNLRKKMGKNSFKMVDSGKFSIKQRNKQLRRIYDEALQ